MAEIAIQPDAWISTRNTRNTNRPCNITPTKDDKSLVTDFQDSAVDKMPDREFGRMIFQKLNEIQENTDNLNEIRKVMQDINEKFSGEIDI